MSSTTRDAKDQPLEDENRPGRPAGPSRHWQTSAGALYAMVREVSRLRGAVVTERHWCAEYVRGRAFWAGFSRHYTNKKRKCILFP